MSRYTANIITKSPATPTGPTTTGRAPGIWRMDEAAYWTRQGLWPNANIQAPDTYFPYVSLLLSTTSLGNANNNLFVDSSGAFNPINRNGNTTQGSFSPYATNWSNYFNGGTDRLQVPVTSNMYLGTTYTIEAWAYYNSSSYGARPIFSQTEAFQGGFAGLNLTLNTSGQLVAEYRPVTSGTVTTITGPTVVPNTWFHIALVSDSSSAKLYVNGTQVGVTTTFGDYPSAKTTFVAVGSWGHGWNDPGIPAAAWIGYISNMRVVKGTAVYTSNFTPSTTPLTAISGTVLLTCQSNRFIDNSSVNNTLTPVSTVSVQDFSPFSPAYPGLSYNQSDITNWSGYFDGSGDYLSAANNAAFQFGTGDFTVECWINKPAAANGSVVDVRSGGTGAVPWAFYVDGSNFPYFYDGTSYTSSVAITTNAWNHIAVVRTSGTLKIFVNGVEGYSQAHSVSLNATGSLLIGGTAAYTTGYISNLRIVKGTAVYTSAFTPPTTNLTAISGTSLLTLQNAAFTDNSTNNFVITPNGNVTVTGNNPFQVGYYSNYITPGNYLVTPSNAKFQFGTGDFTVEAWVNLTAYDASYSNVYSSSRNEVDSGGVALLISSTGALRIFSYVSNAYVATGGTVPLNQWVHVAMARQGTTLRLFLNGALSASASNSQDFLGFAEAGGIGGWGGANAGSFTGYISNVRIVKGTAVYTAAFTPPTSPLTVISGTSLLACAARAYYIDLSNNFSVGVVSAVPPTNAYNPFYTSTIASNGGSMYFDGSGDYLALQNNPSYALGTGDFIVETWVYPLVQGGHGSNNNDCIIDFRPGTGGGAYGTLYIRSSGTGVSWYANTTNVINGGAIPNGAWSHLMVSRVSGSTRMFINGVQSGSTYTDSTNYLQSNPWIGQFNDGGGAGWFQGYMSGMRIVKGTGVSSAFTPPTAPVSPTPATTLLVNGMNAGAYDATTTNNLETVGNAQVSTVQSKFGGSSVYFDGSSDWLYIPSSQALRFGGSFTVEFWINFSDVRFNNVMIAGSSGNTQMYILTKSNSTGLRFGLTNGSEFATGSQTWVGGTWYHVALVRNGTDIRFYVNGVNVTDGTPAANSTVFSGAMNIGDNNTLFGVTAFNGYIDDLRITNGVARYTSNFTPPTQAFPTY